MSAYYNDHDPFVCAWLTNLIAARLLPPGDVDSRSITEVSPDDLRPYIQCHFFAGICGWPLALRRGGWPDDRPAWTGSAPCQPFSQAGMGDGYDDERHLAPAFLGLVAECRPAAVFGEQVASALGRDWLSDLRLALESLGYAVGAGDLCSAGVGGAHIRQRLYWGAVRLADADDAGLEGRGEPGRERAAERAAGARGVARGMGFPDSAGREPGRATPAPARQGHPPFAASGDDYPRAPHGFWRDADWLFCRDGKWRPVEPGSFPLAHGVPGRVGRLRAYGNAIDPEVGAIFVRSFTEAMRTAA